MLFAVISLDVFTRLNLSIARVWILMMKALRLVESVQEVDQVLVEPPLHHACLSCWMAFVNADLVVAQGRELVVPSPCLSIRQPGPRLSDAEPQLFHWVQKTSRTPGRAPASSNLPPHSYPGLPVCAL